MPSLVGGDAVVPLVTGGTTRYVNLDNAASSPCLTAVRDKVVETLELYASVHRGTGWKSHVTTERYEQARGVAGFVGARPDDAVMFAANTTDALNRLCWAVGAEATVIVETSNHHANLLPWRRCRVIELPVSRTPDEAFDRIERALRRSRCKLVAITGAGNVTGELWPIREIADLAHRYGARIVVDAAQLAPHHPINMAEDQIDYLAFSGHKIYAPFGAGVLIGRPDWLTNGEPMIAGGGAVKYVRTDSVMWAHRAEDRQEAGSPNVIGAVALTEACRILQAVGMGLLAADEGVLFRDARKALGDVPKLRIYQQWPVHHPRIGVITFNIEGMAYAKLAAILSAEYGIAVRHGCFCAHPLMASLLGIEDDQSRWITAALRAGRTVAEPGGVRASLGIGSTGEDVTALVDALHQIVESGPAWAYDHTPDHGHYWPISDPRELSCC
jgi:selenocysteine lyase/cysteine desulfurase